MSLSQLKNLSLDSKGNNQSQAPAPGTPGNAPVPNYTAQQSTPQNSPAQQMNTSVQGTGGDPSSPSSPMDKWAFLTDNGSQKNQNGAAQEGKQNPASNPEQQGNNQPADPTIPTADQITAAMGKANFLGNITDDQVTEAQQDPAKFRELLAQVARNSATMATNVSMQGMQPYLEHSATKTQKSAAAEAQATIKAQTVQGIISADPTISDPKFGPVVNMVTQRYMDAYPDATAQQIANVARDYLVENFGVQSQSQASAGQENSGWEDIPGIG